MQIIKGRKKMPFNLILFGVPGIGKSTWAASAPKPVFIGSEENDELEVDRFPIPESFDAFKGQLAHLIANPMGYRTVVVDTLDAIEKLLHKKILASDPKQTGAMIAAHGGYGKAYEKAESELIEIRAMLKTLRDKHGMNVILLAHSKKVKATDTVLGLEYDTFELALHPKAQAVFVDWVSAVLFANYVAKAKDGVNSDKVFAMGHGQRTLFTEKRPGHLGKNRYSLPFEMDLDFAQFYDAFNAFYDSNETDPAKLIAKIAGLMSNISDKALVETISKTVEDNKDNLTMLKRVVARIEEMIGA